MPFSLNQKLGSLLSPTFGKNMDLGPNFVINQPLKYAQSIPLLPDSPHLDFY